MPPITALAICLRTWEYSETSQTVRLLTRTHGTLRGLAKGARREPGGRFCGGFEPLTRGSVVAYVKPGRELANLAEWSVDRLYRAVRRDLEANRAALLMADLVQRLLTDDDPSPEVFDALDAALGALDDAPPGTDPWPTTLGFQWRLLDACGYRPDLDRDVRTGETLDDPEAILAFRPFDGGLSRPAPGDAERSPRAWMVRPATVAALRATAAHGSPGAGTDPDAVRRANRLLASFARTILDRDLPAMRWAFGPDER